MDTARSQARQLLSELAAKAKTTLPDSHGRIDKALALVLAGDVELLADGTAVVGSSCDPLQEYSVNGACPCADYARAPEHWCKHKLARALAIRLSRALPSTVETPAVSHSEAPCSANVHVTIDGRDVLITVRGLSEGEVLSRVERVLAQYPLPADATSKEGWCHKHGVQMRWNEGKDGKAGWWSHKGPDGQWCKGR